MSFSHVNLAISLLLSWVFIASAADVGYGSKPNIEKPELDKDKLLTSLIGIQGLVYCKTGTKHFPLEGAVARITCICVDEYGYETSPMSFLSGATDLKGYFFAALSPYEVQGNWKVKECKAFLELSPLQTCEVPTDINQGISGAPLASYGFLDEKNMKLFTVGPFFYTSGPKSTSNRY
ncbi:hypothetical protein K2173_010247 [Erythroxylum novogranatense]|uniref:Uncharacterized protein n=1 Tax=Erythroxylum novogranatense TaxID=1862640 RepID=A0AAV8UAM3_9ROSI|nr:hypothetical protein K2173_010247 [Erythroxylum novogranatense]